MSQDLEIRVDYTHERNIWNGPIVATAISRIKRKPVFCAISRRRVFGPFFFAEDTVTGKVYLDMLEDAEVQGYIYRQDGATPLWRKEFRGYIIEHLRGRYVGRAAATDNTCTWPPRSPDLTVCDFFLWGFIMDTVYVPPLPKTLPELQREHQHRNRERHTRHA